MFLFVYFIYPLFYQGSPLRTSLFFKGALAKKAAIKMFSKGEVEEVPIKQRGDFLFGQQSVVFFALEGSSLSEMTRKYRSGSHDKGCSNSLNAKELCFSASFLIPFSIGRTIHPLRKERRTCCPIIP